MRLGTDVQMHDALPVVIGVDIGQKVDPSAVAVVEAFETERLERRQQYRFEVRHIERLPLGTDYRDVGRRVAAVAAGVQRRERPFTQHPPKLTIVVDATGVGTPACDILRGELAREGVTATLTEATFNHGDRLTGRAGTTAMTVGKGFLVSRLKALLATDRVFLPPDHPEAAAMADELRNYEIRVTEDGHDRYGAFAVGSHDDLATALGLAVLTDPVTRGKLYAR